MAKAKKTDAAAEAAPAPAAIIAYKGFDPAWSCRGYQYEIGKTFVHQGEVEACASGFHSCENPLDVFGYYPPGMSRYAEVQIGGAIARHAEDSKIASAEITVKAEIKLPDFIARAIKYVIDHATAGGQHETGDRSAAMATGDRSAAMATGDRSAAMATGDQSAAMATGYQSAASDTGHQSAAMATGDRSAAMATGYQSAASATGDQSAASATGHRSAAMATGDRSAAMATGDQSAASATGYQSAAMATGDRSAAMATGDQSAASATGDRSAAMACGYDGRVSGKDGNALFLVERNARREIVAVWAGIAGRDGIEADTLYRLVDGKPQKV